MLRINLRLKPKVWYQFLKHSLMTTAHDEIVNKARLILLHQSQHDPHQHFKDNMPKRLCMCLKEQ